MKRYFLPYILLFITGYSKEIAAQVQKPVIDTGIIDKWPVPMSISDVHISNNGRYVLSYIRNTSGYAMELKSIDGSWSNIFPMINNGQFTDDSKWTVIKSRDSLCLIKNGTHVRKWMKNIREYHLFTNQQESWIGYRPAITKNREELILWNINTNQYDSLENVSDFIYYPQAQSFITLRFKNVSESINRPIALIGLKALGSVREKIIWSGPGLINHSINTSPDLLAFVTGEGSDGNLKKCIWYYVIGRDTAVKLFDERNPAMDTNLKIGNDRMAFSNKGSKLYFSLTEKEEHLPDPNDPIKVDVWNYKEIPLHEERLRSLDAKSFNSVIDIASGKMYQLEDSMHKVYDTRTGYLGDKFAVSYNGSLDFWWNGDAKYSVFLNSVENGTRHVLKDSLLYSPSFQGLRFRISPEEKYVVYFDPVLNSFFSYSIAGKQFINISKRLKTSWKKYTNNEVADPVYGEPFGIAAWGEHDSVVYVYDAHDIWQLDLKGIRNPISITNEYGRINGINFQLMGGESPTRVLHTGEKLLLMAVDSATKKSGFFTCESGSIKDPVMLSMGPYQYSAPIKAGYSKTWIVIRESAVDAPNAYVTTDFRKFARITNSAPQKEYNWLTSQLLSWKSLDGNWLQGILYKPENFDSTKRYPLIFHYYELKSDGLNEFKRPLLMRDNLNIPYFVSRGYLVFQPDIKYQEGVGSGRAAYNSVVSAADYLSQFSWVDKTRMGLQGHSFGGGETNYLVTHTDKFAAAVEAAGPSDDICSYNAIGGDGFTPQFYFEIYQGRIRQSLWENPSLYIENSAVLSADRMQTPLLMMHNKGDRSVPWSQGSEFFSALRRLKKKVWMLQYDDAGHSIGGVQALDYTIRVEQFFDYYLKGKKPPVWMTKGVPPSQKGYEYGYSLDSSGIAP